MKTITILLPDNLEDLTPEQLGAQLQQAGELEKYFKAAREYAKAQLTAGKPVIGWEMAPGKRSRVWKSDDAAKNALAEQGINDPYKPQELLSVAEAEKKVSDVQKLEAAWDWVPGSKTLKPASVSAALAASATKPNYGF